MTIEQFEQSDTLILCKTQKEWNSLIKVYNPGKRWMQRDYISYGYGYYVGSKGYTDIKFSKQDTRCKQIVIKATDFLYSLNTTFEPLISY